MDGHPAETSNAGLSDTEVIRSLPKDQPVLGEITYQTVEALPLCRQDGYYYCRIRAGIPHIYWRIYLRTLDSCRLLGDLVRSSHNLTFI